MLGQPFRDLRPGVGLVVVGYGQQCLLGQRGQYFYPTGLCKVDVS